MRRSPFTTGWQFRPLTSAFSDLIGSAAVWEDVVLPHDAALTGQRSPDHGPSSGYLPGGSFQYRTSLTVPEQWRDQTVALEFEGVHRSARVLVNGALAARQADGSTQFTVALDAHLRPGEVNHIEVQCRTRTDARWYAGAGIHRPVHLLVGPLTHIEADGVTVRTLHLEEGYATVEVATAVRNVGRVIRRQELLTEVHGPDGELLGRDRVPVTVAPGEPAIARQRFSLTNPAAWSPESPTLHTTTVELIDGEDTVDDSHASFGVRTVRADPDRGLTINGHTVQLRGACIHSDNGVLGAAAIGRADERRVQLLLDAGFNALRSAHNPASRALLEACDRLGMLVVDELTDGWTRTKSDADHALEFPEWWETDVAALVAKDRNHPSVIMYSIGNEIPEVGATEGRLWSRRIAERIRQLDDTRLVTNGINGILAVDPELPPGGINELLSDLGSHWERVAASDRVGEATAEAFAVLDVAGMNYMHSRYELDRPRWPGRVVVGTETFPTDIDRLWRLVQDNPHVIGDFTWTGWDYLGEAGIGRVADADDPTAGRPGAPYPWLLAWCGDIDITGFRRPASYYREIVFGLRTQPYLAVQRPRRHGRALRASPWAWTDSVGSWAFHGVDGQPVTVEIYSQADDVELVLNGRSLGRASAGEAHRFRATFEVVWEPGELTAIARTAGAETGRTSLLSAGPDVSLSVTADRPVLTHDDRDLAFLDITLIDAHGTIALDLDRPVSVEVSGPGVLAGLGSAAPATEESYRTATHTTFDGRLLAVVRPTGTGTITVTAQTADSPAVSVSLHVTVGAS